ncbi:MAG: hypothetical protein AAGF11_42185 [Myxococcota bacterium]
MINTILALFLATGMTTSETASARGSTTDITKRVSKEGSTIVLIPMLKRGKEVTFELEGTNGGTQKIVVKCGKKSTCGDITIVVPPQER